MTLDEETRALERAVRENIGDMPARRKLHTILGAKGYGQCDDCGGSISELVDCFDACETCGGTGVLPPDHPKIRRCAHAECNKPLHPSHLAVYCSGGCAWGNA